MTAHSQNGWPVTDIETVRYVIPGAKRTLTFVAGPVGFILACHALWYHRTVEPLSPESVMDDWSYDSSQRNVRDGSDISNHCSATAMDLNATQHPRSTTHNPAGAHFTKHQINQIHKRLRRYEAMAYDVPVSVVNGHDSNDGDWIIRWGYDYTRSTDGMHFEWNMWPSANKDSVRRLARRLSRRPVGRAILAANPHAKEYV